MPADRQQARAYILLGLVMLLWAGNSIVGRAVTNREYRERLLARPEEALKGYRLTDEEMCRVKDWTNRTFEILIHDLERQVVLEYHLSRDARHV